MGTPQSCYGSLICVWCFCQSGDTTVILWLPDFCLVFPSKRRHHSHVLASCSSCGTTCVPGLCLVFLSKWRHHSHALAAPESLIGVWCFRQSGPGHRSCSGSLLIVWRHLSLWSVAGVSVKVGTPQAVRLSQIRVFYFCPSRNRTVKLWLTYSSFSSTRVRSKSVKALG